MVAVGIDLPEIFIQIEFRQCFDQFHIGFPIRFDGAYILPVSTEAISVEGLAFFQHFGNDVFPEITVGMDGIVLNERFTQSAPCEDINPHGCQIALWIFGFFFEFIDLVVFFCVHDTEAARFFHGHFQNGNGCCRAFFLMEAQHLGIVHFIDVVPRKDEYIFRIVAVDEINILIDSIGSPHEPFPGISTFDMRRQNGYTAVFLVQIPGNTDADVLIQTQRLILGQNAHGIHAGIDTVTERKVDDTESTAVSHSRFRNFPCENPQAAALSAR